MRWFVIHESDCPEVPSLGVLREGERRAGFDADPDIRIERAEGDMVRVIDGYGVIRTVSDPCSWNVNVRSVHIFSFTDQCGASYSIHYFPREEEAWEEVALFRGLRQAERDME